MYGSRRVRGLRVGVGLALALAVGCAGRSTRTEADGSESAGAGAEIERGGSQSSGGSGALAGTLGVNGGATSSGVGGDTGVAGTGPGGGICLEATIEPSFAAQNLYVLLDRSKALGDGDRYNRAFETLSVLFSHPGLVGTGVSFGTFPDGAEPPRCNEMTCSTEACGAPLVGLGKLTVAGIPQDRQEARLTDALSDATPVDWAPPLSAALHGAYSWAERQRLEHPDERWHIVLITTGASNVCGELPFERARHAFDVGRISTHVFVFEQELVRTPLDELAVAGGTAVTRNLGPDPGPPVDGLIADMGIVSGAAIVCDFEFPRASPQRILENSVQVSFMMDGAVRHLYKVSDRSACLGEFAWHYDDEDNPAKIVLCPVACVELATYRYPVKVAAACEGPPLP